MAKAKKTKKTKTTKTTKTKRSGMQVRVIYQDWRDHMTDELMDLDEVPGWLADRDMPPLTERAMLELARWTGAVEVSWDEDDDVTVAYVVRTDGRE